MGGETEFIIIVDRNLIKTTTRRQIILQEMIHRDRSETMNIQVQIMNLTMVQKPYKTTQTTLVSSTSTIMLPYGVAQSLEYIHFLAF